MSVVVLPLEPYPYGKYGAYWFGNKLRASSSNTISPSEGDLQILSGGEVLELVRLLSIMP